MVNRHMEPYFVTIPPSGTFSSVFQHIGEECLVALEGKIEFTVGEQTISLEQDDSIYFDCVYPHAVHNKGPENVRCILIIYAPNQD